MKPPKLIIFDWDGTLVDSVGRIIDCFNKSYAYYNLEIPTAKAIRQTIGLPLREGFAQLKLGSKHPGYDALCLKYRDFWLAPEQKSSPAFSFSYDLVARLSQQGHTMAVATGKSRAGLDREIHHHRIAPFIQATICGDESQAKPHPEMLLRILEQTKIEPQAALMLGDSPLDLEMANLADIPSVGVLSGSGDHQELANMNPVAILENAGSLDQLWSKAFA